MLPKCCTRLPVANQNSAITKHVVELFTAQDAVLQKKMAESGLHRWGSKWLWPGLTTRPFNSR